ncbi:MAG: hypothetical protein U5R06_10350 [candidate division KSB1 bacterium]|nr:hypothetical protein [candidate division KSB1 bacterium]
MKMWKCCASVLILLSGLACAQNTYINVDGNWNLNIDVSDLTGGPGSNIQSIYNSTNEGALIDLDVLKARGEWWYWFFRWDWQVEVHIQSVNWQPDWEIWVRRTGDGDFFVGNIQGGETFQQLNSMGINFCSGSHNHNNIPLEYELRGVSLPLEAGQYSAIVYYTLTEL